MKRNFDKITEIDEQIQEINLRKDSNYLLIMKKN